MSDTAPLVDRTYEFIIGDEEERACRDIPDAACTDVPRNFLFNAANGAMTKLAEQIVSPGLVLPWVLGAIGAPAAMAAWLVPTKQAGSLLPQLFVAGWIRGLKRRKWVWFGAGITQAGCLFAMIFALGLPPLFAGLAIVSLLACFSIASGAGSVAFSDVVGKTIPKGRRGRLLAVRASIGGALGLAAGSALRLSGLDEAASLGVFILLLGSGAMLWAVAAFTFAAITEEPGATEGGENIITRVISGTGHLRESAALRRFILARGLLLSGELAVPFLVLFGRERISDKVADLGIFIMAVAFANIISAPVWGKAADRSSRTVMAWAGLVTVATVGVALVIGVLPETLRSAWLYAVVFFLIGLAQAGIRLGRKTYIVDLAPQDLKATYTALSNTIVGIIALASGLLGFVAGAFGAAVLLIVFALSAGVGAVVSWSLPDVSTPD